MHILLGLLVLFRFLQTAAYISLFFFSLIKLRQPRKKRVAITVAIYIAVASAYCAFLFVYGQERAERLIIPVEIGLCLILLIICSADKWAISLFVMFTQFNLYLGICYLSDVCATEASGLTYQFEYLIYRTVLFGAFLFFNFKYLRPRFRRLVDVIGKEWKLITLAAFFFYVLEAVILYCPRFYWYETDNRWYLVASSYLVFFSVYLLIFRSISAIVGKYEAQERERILAQQNKMWEEQLEEQKNAVNAARRDRHDLRHHYDTLLSMLEGGKTQGAVSYLTAQTQRTESVVLSAVCQHPAANAILSRWAARARENGIRTEIDASIPANLPMDDVALAGILANAFENAVEGCLRTPEGAARFISVNIAYSVYNGAGKLHIVFENSCADNIVFESDLPKSQKPGGGTGTKSIAYAAERYKGMAEFTAQDGVFRTRVLLHLSQQA
ncbi:GHKL domain-containing protein [Oscillibacter sp.]|uniref:sensor histidine kinase n=1 Tax=Oscillibacter sp. TaxID=1945593 RepID=UPI0028A03C61|nr:GHKL domain-containing protein [Oscillibacter sp.]